MRSFAIFVLLSGLLHPAPGADGAGASASPDVGPPPPGVVATLELDPFYQKYLSVGGLPIVASGRVSDHALLEAAYLVGRMIGHRPDLIEAIAGEQVRIAIMAVDEFTTDVPEHATLQPAAYWDRRARGLGASRERPAVSCGEENLLGFAGDPYAAESIFIHEFAHTIHQQGLNVVDPAFQGRLERAFGRASLKGLWKGKYAGTNPAEYWAEGVQSWFDTNREDDFDHNHVDTREELRDHDPELARLIESVFGDGDWRYRPPRERRGRRHLAGHGPKEKRFSWPEEMVRAYEDHQAGRGLATIEMRDPGALPAGARSPRSRKSVSVRFRNGRAETLSFSWIDFDGERREYGKADPGREFRQSTFSGHLWLITGEDGSPVAWAASPEKDAFGVVE